MTHFRNSSLVFLLLFFSSSQEVRAVEIVAANAADLAQLIGQANNNFSNETFTIRLLNDIHLDDEIFGSSGNAFPTIQPLKSSSKVIIIGDRDIDGDGLGDGGVVTISRSASAPEFRFFWVRNSGGRTGKLSLSNLSLEGGNLSGFYGGAIFVGAGAWLNLNDVSLINNRVSSLSSDLPAFGGALYVQGSTPSDPGIVNITDSRFINNMANNASSGGAIYVANTDMAILRTSFEGNTASREGGAIFADSLSETISIQNSDFTQNIAPRGAAIRLLNNTKNTILSSTIFENNSRNGDFAAGGLGTAVYATGSETVRFIRSTVNGNSGTAVRISDGMLELLVSTVSGNSRVGLELTTNSSAMLDSSTIAFNGSGFSSQAGVSLNKSSIETKRSIITANNGGEFNTEIKCVGFPPTSVNLTLQNSLFGDSRVDLGAALDTNCTFEIQGGSNIFASVDQNAATPINRILKPLADNGCEDNQLAGYPATARCAKTHALSEGSPALDAVIVGSRSFDQRGFPNIGLVDMGSYEGFIADPACFVIPVQQDKVVSFCL